jgi:ABC-2 type transport system ATP-binding protein
MSANSVEITRLTQRFSSQIAVDDLTMSIKQGEVFGFLGHNGAGKTTTIQMLTTLDKPFSGTARIADHDLLKDPMGVRKSIGYVPENVRLYDSLSAYETLMFFAQLSQIDTPAKRVIETLEILDSVDLAKKRVGGFSKGMRQRIGLAQAILHRPSVLFLDEPTSGLDPMGIKLLRDLILRLNREFGMTIFMNTHLISEIAKTCTSIGVLSHGRLVFHDRMEVITEKYGDDAKLETLYLSLDPAQSVKDVA